jgi:hypothetical protein
MAGMSEMRPSRVREVPPPMNAPRPASAAPDERVEPIATKTLPAWRRGFGAAVPWLLAVFLVCLVFQVFLAGMGLLGGSTMEAHTSFIHVFEFVPILIALCGFLGADKVAGWSGIVLMILIEAQYALIYSSIGILRAMHPVNALVISGITFALLLQRPLLTPQPA